MADGLLSGFRALDLTDYNGFACGKILATLGVEVIKVEKPGGDPGRRIPPFFKSEGLYWLCWNTDKRSITLDLETSQGRDLFKKLVAKSDFVLESFQPGYLDHLDLGYEGLCKANPKIILASISPFGQKGPQSHYKGPELVVSAMSGVLDNTGFPDRAPSKEALDSCYFHANVAAALGSVMAHYYRGISGEGQHVDVSSQEVASSRTIINQVLWEFDKRLLKRSGPVNQFGTMSFRWVWTCKDGHVFWSFVGGAIGSPANKALSGWIDEDGMENPLREIDWDTFDIGKAPAELAAKLQETVAEFFLKHTTKEIAEQGLKRGANTFVVNNVVDVFEPPQLAARDFWITLDHPELGTSLTYPRQLILSSETENFVTRRAPTAGEHNHEIYGEELGLSSEEITSLQTANAI